MKCSSRRRNLKRGRQSASGSQLVEFSAALVILTGFIFLPLLDLAIVPIRWMMAQEIVNGYIRQLTLCESSRESIKFLLADPSLATRLQKIGGISVESVKLRMRITRTNTVTAETDNLSIDLPGTIPEEWLPDGVKGPFTYQMELLIQSMMSPAILLPKIGSPIPGLTAPIPLALTASHQWQNLGRNPVTGKFFLNE